MIGFRVDANEIIATGHLMRCISIAERIRKLGEKCFFFMAENKCTNILSDRNFDYEILNTNWEDLESEIPDIQSAVKRNNISMLIIDSYKATLKYCEAVEKITNVMVIDAREDIEYHVSSILNYSHLNNEEDMKQLYKNSKTKLLLGLMYAPLREEFFPASVEVSKERRILITTGGTDPNHIAYGITDALLKDERFNDISFDVVLGSLCKDAEDIKKLDEKRVILHQGISYMSELMRKDIAAFTAGGSTSIELCACKTPTVCFSFVDNQIPFSKVLDDNGVISYIGDYRDGRDDLFDKAKDELFRYVFDEKYRSEHINRMMDVCDGMGADRIAHYVVKR